ncbi:PQQ-binding-like beta-propeller repeat protein [Streptomyces sp. NPDC002889]|uniref:outer membrane protein assembly factor BamB family protein n=1 Tax=Streptomyces sp. NPDC002889 TaxID=3364669 RepID=UPI0036B0DFED
MEPLQQDDPRRIGPYTTRARLRESASAVQYLAYGSDDAPVVVSSARPGLAAVPAFRRRFAAEARTAERLAGGWVPQPLAMATDERQELWTASAYIPALTLRAAIALVGPLPERAVRVLGAGLAETLSRVHATGTVLHGLAPDTVLLAADGPRLTAFGALGAAAVAQTRPGGQLSVQLSYLTPEQATGAEPGPASDVFVLGLLLAYATTGTTPLGGADGIAHDEPRLDAMPGALRELTARCLSKRPQDRPTAGTVAADLALEGAAALGREGWLPQPVLDALTAEAVQAASLRSGRPGVQDAPASASGTGAGAEAGTGTGRVSAPDVPLGAGTAAPQALIPARSDASHLPVAGEAAARAGDSPALPAVALASGAGPVPGNGGAAAPPMVPPQSAGATVPPGPGAPRTSAGAAGSVPDGRQAFTGPSAATADGAGLVADTSTLLVRRHGSAPVAAVGQAWAGQPVPAGSPGWNPPPAAPTDGPVPPPPAGTVGRRGVLAAVAAGVAGVVVGGGGVYAVVGGDTEADPAPRPPAPRRTRMAGLAPEPNWRYEHPSEPLGVTVWRDRVLLLTDSRQTTGVDLRTGRRLWARPEAPSASRAVPVDDRFCLVDAPDELLWISAQDGQVAHKVAKRTFAQPGETLALGGVIGAEGAGIWLTGHVSKSVERTVKKRKKKVTVREAYVIAYDLAGRKQLWRARVPAGKAPQTPRYDLVVARPDSIVVRQDGNSLTPAQSKAAKGGSVLLGLDRATGKALGSVPLHGVGSTAAVVGDGGSGKLFGAAGRELHAYDGKGKRLWRVPAATTPGEKGVFAYGIPVVHGPALYAANRYQEVCAVDTATGRPLWRRSTETPAWRQTPRTALSAGGRTVLAGDAVALTAFAARDGRRLWKFQEAGARDAGNPQDAPRYEPLPGGDGRLVVRRGRTFYALPVD